MRIEDAYVPWHHFLHRSEAEVVNASVERARISPEAKSNPQPPHAMHRSLGEVVWLLFTISYSWTARPTPCMAKVRAACPSRRQPFANQVIQLPMLAPANFPGSFSAYREPWVADRVRVRPNRQPPHEVHRSLDAAAAEGRANPNQRDEEPLYLQALVALLLTCQQGVVELQMVVDATEVLVQQEHEMTRVSKSTLSVVVRGQLLHQ